MEEGWTPKVPSNNSVIRILFYHSPYGIGFDYMEIPISRDTVIQFWISNIGFFMRICAVLDDNSTVPLPDDR